jgi:hypothetical protein
MFKRSPLTSDIPAAIHAISNAPAAPTLFPKPFAAFHAISDRAWAKKFDQDRTQPGEFHPIGAPEGALRAQFMFRQAELPADMKVKVVGTGGWSAKHTTPEQNSRPRSDHVP